MARPLVGWIGAALFGCGLCAAVYLPPRELPRWAWNAGSRNQAANVSRLRARRLAEDWREVNARLEGARRRDEVRAAVRARRAAGEFGPALIGGQSDTLLARTQPALAAALDTVWSQLGIGESKIGVAVLIRAVEWRAPAALRPQGEGVYGLSFLLPDSTDRETCLSQARSPLWLRNRRHPARADLRDWARAVLGPCAYYARFGVPSARVESWLARRHFDLALVPAWETGGKRFGEEWDSSDTAIGDRWWLWQLYSWPRSTAACFAGRPQACRRAFAAADGGPDGPRPRAIIPPNRWDAGKTLLVGGENFFSAVLRQSGPDRFQEFWTTTLPVDSALTLALAEPAGDFIVRYQRSIGREPQFGATTRPLDAGLGLVFALLVLGIVAAAQGRREVQ